MVPSGQNKQNSLPDKMQMFDQNTEVHIYELLI